MFWLPLLFGAAAIWLDYGRHNLPVTTETQKSVVKTLKRMKAGKQALGLLSVEGAPVDDVKVAINVLRLLQPNGTDILLGKTLTHDDVTVRRAAALALRLVGSTRALAQLCTALDDPDRFVRDYVIQAFGAPKDQGARNCLRRRLGKEEDEMIRAELKASLAE